jgi:hypothetical protein|tara:strand:- start:5565 stop:5900 length:336 start_codon:yes stop_codon:yes gene_type:complete
MKPRRKRVIFRNPLFTDFRPPGSYWKEPISLTFDELEAMRLKHFEKLDQREACKKMRISQPTFHRILSTAHQKTTDALISGRGLRIKGGKYRKQEPQKQQERIRPRYFVNP